MATDIKNDVNLSVNLVSHWKLDEASGTRVDSHGSNDLTDNNTVTSTTGAINDGAQFTAANSEYLSITDGTQSGLDFSAGSTFNFYVKPAANPSSTEYIFSKSGTGAGNRGYSGAYYDNGGTPTLRLLASSNGTSFALLDHAVTLSTSAFTMVTMVVDTINTDLYIYINGSLAATQSTGISAQWSANSFPFLIGALGTTPIAQFFNGVVDEFTVWSRALPSSDVTALYNSGTPLPYEAAGESLTAESGSFTLTGSDVTLSYSGDTTLNAGSGSFTLTGADATLLHNRVLNAEAGSFTLTGADVTLTAPNTDYYYPQKRYNATLGKWERIS